jgi:hypothetical protein
VNGANAFAGSASSSAGERVLARGRRIRAVPHGVLVVARPRDAVAAREVGREAVPVGDERRESVHEAEQRRRVAFLEGGRRLEEVGRRDVPGDRAQQVRDRGLVDDELRGDPGRVGVRAFERMLI